MSRRTEAAGGPVRSLTREPVVLALVLLVPQALLGAVVLAAETVDDGPPVKPFWWLSVTFGYTLALLGTLLLAFVVVVAALGGRRAPDRVAEPS